MELLSMDEINEMYPNCHGIIFKRRDNPLLMDAVLLTRQEQVRSLMSYLAYHNKINHPSAFYTGMVKDPLDWYAQLADYERDLLTVHTVMVPVNCVYGSGDRPDNPNYVEPFERY